MMTDPNRRDAIHREIRKGFRFFLIVAAGLGFLLAGVGFTADSGDGEGQPPRLLNKGEILGMLQLHAPMHDDSGREMKKGDVFTELAISSGGVVTDVRVIRSNGIQFSRQVWHIAKHMRFAPALQNSKPVAAKVQQEFVFFPAQDASSVVSPEQ